MPEEALVKAIKAALLVYRFIETGTYYNGTSNASNFRQRCTTGATLISIIPLSMRSLSSSQEATRIPRRNVRAIFPNKVSTRSFIDPQRFRGTCYRAANWIHLGLTTGRGKNDQTKRPNRSLKQLWVYPLRPDFRRHRWFMKEAKMSLAWFRT